MLAWSHGDAEWIASVVPAATSEGSTTQVSVIPQRHPSARTWQCETTRRSDSSHSPTELDESQHGAMQRSAMCILRGSRYTPVGAYKPSPHNPKPTHTPISTTSQPHDDQEASIRHGHSSTPSVPHSSPPQARMRCVIARLGICPSLGHTQPLDEHVLPAIQLPSHHVPFAYASRAPA